LLVSSKPIWRKAVPTFARLLAVPSREMVATISRDWPATAGRADAMLQQTGWRDALFVEARQITSRAGQRHGCFIAIVTDVAKPEIEQFLANR
jgi:hypothetical protein